MSARSLDGLTHAGADWAGLDVVVAGIGVSGFAAADALVERGARVLVVDEQGTLVGALNSNDLMRAKVI